MNTAVCTPESSPSSHLSLEIADFASRIKAFLLDSFIYFIVTISAAPILNMVSGFLNLPWLGTVIFILLVITFEALQVTIWGRTLGHAALKLRVFNQKGRNPSFLQASGRWIIKVVLGAAAFLTLLRGTGRTAHDILTRTSVRHVA